MALTVSGLRNAIEDGRYAPGEILPTQEELAQVLGVSVRVTREAMAQLATEGFVMPQGRRGTTVLSKRGKRWKGRVVYLHSPYVGSYHFARFEETLAHAISEAGYLFASVVVPLPTDFPANVPPRIERSQVMGFVAASCRDADLVLMRGCLEYAGSAIDHCGVPWIALHEEAESVSHFKNCKGVAPPILFTAIEEFMLHCRLSGVHRVTLMELRQNRRIEDALARADIVCERWIVEPYDLNVLETYAQAAFEAMRVRLDSVAHDLPDLLVVTDDYLAQGALVALLAAGVRVPDDVKVATLVNKGNAPVFPISLTCFEVDPVRRGEVVAQCALAYLKDGVLPEDVTVVDSYVKGASFP